MINLKINTGTLTVKVECNSGDDSYIVNSRNFLTKLNEFLHEVDMYEKVHIVISSDNIFDDQESEDTVDDSDFDYYDHNGQEFGR